MKKLRDLIKMFNWGEKLAKAILETKPSKNGV